MASSFFFYDLETSGVNPRSGRVMQFAGQRTNTRLEPIGEPVNLFIKLTPDILPEPDAIMITGITPQQTISDGLTEAEFLKFFFDEVVKPGTIFTGFNSVRFDDEFMRYMLYRNFYDAYEWQWKDGCGRWDILDVARMTRALRPDGIEWGFASDGKPSNRLELLSNVNKLAHTKVHDALSDVVATIDVARLIKQKQPDLFDYLLHHRGKVSLKPLVLKGAPFVYTSGRYSSKFLHTTAAVLLENHPKQDAALVYDLRYDPAPFAKMSLDEIVKAWQYSRDPKATRLPVKTLKYNRCPTLAPLGVMKDTAAQERIGLTLETVSANLASLKQHRAELVPKVLAAIERLDQARERDQASLVEDQLTVDERLYDGFIGKADAAATRAIRTAKPADLTGLAASCQDSRLKSLLPLYKARNYPAALDPEERAQWDEFCYNRLAAGGQNSWLAKYFARLQELAVGKLTGQQQYILEELQLYGQSLVPAELD